MKTEFTRFSTILEKVKKKLEETGNTIEEAANRSRQLEKKLKKVEALSAPEATSLLGDLQSSEEVAPTEKVSLLSPSEPLQAA